MGSLFGRPTLRAIAPLVNSKEEKTKTNKVAKGYYPNNYVQSQSAMTF